MLRSLFIVSLLSLCVFAQQSPSSCSYKDNNTNLVYDVSSLAIPTDSPLTDFYYYNDTQPSAAGNYVFNICEAVNSTLFDQCDNETAVCQIDFEGNTFSCGQVTNGVFSNYGGDFGTNGQGVTVTYSHGTFCNGPQINRTTIIDIGCSPGTGYNVSALSEDACVYHIQMWADAGCSINATSPTPNPTAPATPTAQATLTATPTAVSNTTSTNTTTFTPTVSATPTVVSNTTSVNMTTLTPTVSATPTVVSNTTSVNMTSLTPTLTPTPANTTSGGNTTTNSTSPIPTYTPANTTTGGNTTTNSTSPLPSPSPLNSTNTNSTLTATATASASSSGSGIESWVWWVLASVLVLILIIAACVAGFVIWKKKQQQTYDFDPIDYE